MLSVQLPSKDWLHGTRETYDPIDRLIPDAIHAFASEISGSEDEFPKMGSISQIITDIFTGRFRVTLIEMVICYLPAGCVSTTHPNGRLTWDHGVWWRRNLQADSKSPSQSMLPETTVKMSVIICDMLPILGTHLRSLIFRSRMRVCIGNEAINRIVSFTGAMQPVLRWHERTAFTPFVPTFLVRVRRRIAHPMTGFITCFHPRNNDIAIFPLNPEGINRIL